MCVCVSLTNNFKWKTKVENLNAKGNLVWLTYFKNFNADGNLRYLM